MSIFLEILGILFVWFIVGLIIALGIGSAIHRTGDDAEPYRADADQALDIANEDRWGALDDTWMARWAKEHQS